MVPRNTTLVNPICAKRFHRHYIYRANGTIEGPLLHTTRSPYRVFLGESTVRGVLPNSLPQMYAMMSLIITEAAGITNLASTNPPNATPRSTTPPSRPSERSSDSTTEVRASREQGRTTSTVKKAEEQALQASTASNQANKQTSKQKATKNNKSIPRVEQESRQDEAREGKARQGKARQGKEGKARQGKARQRGKARQGKERQGKALKITNNMYIVLSHST